MAYFGSDVAADTMVTDIAEAKKQKFDCSNVVCLPGQLYVVIWMPSLALDNK